MVQEIKLLLHSKCKANWTSHNNGYQAYLEPIRKLERAQQTTIFCLRTRHCGLRAHLKRTGVSDTSLCECGHTDQTPDHILQACFMYTKNCHQTRPNSVDLATKLWGMAEDLRRTAGFAAPLGLRI